MTELEGATQHGGIEALSITPGYSARHAARAISRTETSPDAIFVILTPSPSSKTVEDVRKWVESTYEGANIIICQLDEPRDEREFLRAVGSIVNIANTVVKERPCTIKFILAGESEWLTLAVSYAAMLLAAWGEELRVEYVRISNEADAERLLGVQQARTDIPDTIVRPLSPLNRLDIAVLLTIGVHKRRIRWLEVRTGLKAEEEEKEEKERESKEDRESQKSGKASENKEKIGRGPLQKVLDKLVSLGLLSREKRGGSFLYSLTSVAREIITAKANCKTAV